MTDPDCMSRRQLQSLHLAGTVVLPTPFPEVGTLCFRPGALKYGTGASEPVDLLVVEHEQSNRLTVLRTVRLQDVAAVMFCRALPPALGADGEWRFGPEVVAALEDRSNRNDASLLRGIVYVREQAPVLMQVEVGMTAAESAEYYPPVVGERTDAHYNLAPGMKVQDCHRGVGCQRSYLLQSDCHRFERDCHFDRRQPG